jgi:hypothetical protein
MIGAIGIEYKVAVCERRGLSVAGCGSRHKAGVASSHSDAVEATILRGIGVALAVVRTSYRQLTTHDRARAGSR